MSQEHRDTHVLGSKENHDLVVNARRLSWNDKKDQMLLRERNSPKIL
jgi:hypothetical protein